MLIRFPYASGSGHAGRAYHYENTLFPFALTGITDESSARFATWGYDAEGRANLGQHHSTSSEGIEIFSFDYQFSHDATDPRITVKNALNRYTTYHLATIRGVNQVIWTEGNESANCAAANQYKSYYPNGTLQTQTDWEGNVTLFERDNLGRITQKTEALKWPAAPQYGLNANTSILQTTTNTKITKTCWHETLNKPERIIEPSSVTHFDYFDNGQLKRKKVEPRSSANESCQ